jgi:ubiquitin-activating enzyme E1
MKVHDQLRRVATETSTATTFSATNDVAAAMRNLKGKEKMAYYRALVIEELRNMGVADPEAPLKAKGTVGAEILDNVVPGFFAALQLDDGTDGDEIAKMRVCPAQVSVIGGMMAQEAIKAITHLHMPISQFFVHHNAVSDGREESWIQRKSRNHVEMWESIRPMPEQLPYPVDVVPELRSLRVFVVGAGAIGCELLKNFAQMGVGVGRSGSTEDNFEEQQAVDVKVTPNNHEKKRSSLWERNGLQRGGVVVTDMDVIERSNLNRQLLFR